MNDITLFLNDTIYPILFERIDTAFPEMNFRRVGRRWESAYKLSGEKSRSGRKDKSVITEKVPHRIMEQGGESLSLIDFYGMRNGISTNTSEGFIEALRGLSAICGVELPKSNNIESYRTYSKKQDALERIASCMKNSLFSDDPKAKAVLSYLTDHRKYNKDFIEFAEFGFLGGSMVDELNSLVSYRDESGDVKELPRGAGTTYSLAIPYRTGGRIKGFVFRTIEEGRVPKYKNAFISASASKKYNLFGLTGINLTGNREIDRDLIIVEGEIDALRASFVGVPNVVAASGGNVYSEALQEAKRRGVKRVTLLFDTEVNKQSQKENYKRLDKAIDTVYEAGLAPFVCYLPSPDGSKVDVDAFLHSHSCDELVQAIERAPAASIFRFNMLVENAIGQEEERELTAKKLEELKSDIIQLANSKYTRPTERGLIFKSFEYCTGERITVDDIQQEADIAKEMQDKALQSQETISLTAEAFRLAKEGKTDEALSLLQEKTTELKKISKEGEFSSLLMNDTVQSIKGSFKNRPVGIGTGYFIETKDGKEEFQIPCGALTYICAPTSHGKSRVLENLAIQLSTNGEEGSVIYFSFEEDASAIKLQLLNMYVNMNLSANNLKSLSSYYKYDIDKFFYKDVKEHYMAEFKKKEGEFFDLLTSGKLRVYYKDYDSTELVEAIRYMSKQIKIKAVFIDYIQLLHKSGTRLQRKDELKDICKDFMALAVETKLPIVMAAQLNREALSPIEMEVQNIAEASDIEHSANIVMLVWNSVVNPRTKSGYFSTKGKEKVLSDEAQKLADKGFDIGTAGKIYITLAKNRGGERNISAVPKFNGNTGRIEPNIIENQQLESDINDFYRNMARKR